MQDITDTRTFRLNIQRDSFVRRILGRVMEGKDYCPYYRNSMIMLWEILLSGVSRMHGASYTYNREDKCFYVTAPNKQEVLLALALISKGDMS
jgi:hypothetical protein